MASCELSNQSAVQMPVLMLYVTFHAMYQHIVLTHHVQTSASAYLNTESVQQALHVYSSRSGFGKWNICSSKLNYQMTATNLPKHVYPSLIEVSFRS